MNNRDTNGQEYWYLTSVNGREIQVLKSWDYGHSPENERYAKGNYFLTRGCAEYVSAKIAEVFENWKKR